MEKMCLWCRYFNMEYRPDILIAPKPNHQIGDELEWKVSYQLFLGCTKGPVEVECKHNYLCDNFKWVAGGDYNDNTY